MVSRIRLETNVQAEQNCFSRWVTGIVEPLASAVLTEPVYFRIVARIIRQGQVVLRRSIHPQRLDFQGFEHRCGQVICQLNVLQAQVRTIFDLAGRYAVGGSGGGCTRNIGVGIGGCPAVQYVPILVGGGVQVFQFIAVRIQDIIPINALKKSGQLYPFIRERIAESTNKFGLCPTNDCPVVIVDLLVAVQVEVFAVAGFPACGSAKAASSSVVW